MSLAVDTNVLLYASDRESRHWDTASRLLQEWSTRDELFYLCWPVIMGYLRIATHPTVFACPLEPKDAIRNVEMLLGLPHTRVLSEGPRFWKTYREITGDLPVRGNLVPDAHVAALLLEHGVREIVTNDADFRKFDFVRVVNPFSA
jgi:uncharacterized protein